MGNKEDLDKFEEFLAKGEQGEEYGPVSPSFQEVFPVMLYP